jgi:replicative DNA helicase
MNVELATLEALFKEGLRRVLADEEAADVRDWLRMQLDRIGGSDDNAVMTWPESFDFTDAMVAQFEAIAAMPPEQRKVLDFPWAQWNQYIDPLEPGMLGVITAPDGMGKTMYAEMIGEHWAARRNRICYVHYELSKSIMMQRRLARHARVTVRDIRSGTLTPEQKHKVAEVRPRLSEWDGQITYVHAPGWTMERTIEQLRKHQAEGACDGVVIDYLEKVAASSRQMKMHLEWFQREADNVEQLKNFAESVGVPVLMVAQMSKSGKSQGIDKLDRTAMRGAGEKSEKANLVVMLTRKREADGYSNEVDVLIDKNTMGKSGNQFKQLMIPEYFDVRDLHE